MIFDAKRFRTRLAVPRDAESLAQVFDCTWNASYRGILPHAAFEEPPDECRADYWQWLLFKKPPSILVLAAVDEDDDPVGLALAAPDRFGGLDLAELHALYVIPGYQRLGLGRRLLCEAFAIMHEAGFKSGIVWVLAEHDSRHFYERLGGKASHRRTSTEWGQDVPQAGYVWPNLGVSFGGAPAPAFVRATERDA